MMKPNNQDYSIFERFKFDRRPVGVKFTGTKPEGFRRLKAGLFFCEMLKEAQNNPPFYVQQEDLQCVESMVLGMADPEPFITAGLVGEADDLFEEARANRKLYQFLPTMPKGSVQYVTFAGLDEMTFDPDVLVVTTPAEKAQPLMRAIGYSSGDMWNAKGTAAVACSWMYIYPVISGEINFNITGISLGMQALEVFPPGLILLSIPWTKIPMMIHNLETMSWDLISHKITGEAHKERFKKLGAELRQKMAGT
jgi:uncharacterized protein (DUF169 family)